MCSSHAPEAGADSEPVDRFDASCDYCGKTVYSGQIRPVTLGRSTSWLCDSCHDRQQAQYDEMVGWAQ